MSICTWCGGTRTTNEGEACPPCGGTGVRGRLRAYVADATGGGDPCMLVVVTTSAARARVLAFQDDNIAEGADHEFIGFSVRRYPEADLYIEPSEGECIWRWGVERFDRRYWKLAWRENDADCCEECGEYVWDTIPETHLADSPYGPWRMCRECLEDEARRKDPQALEAAGVGR